jgi:cardiolipin synthase
MKKPILINVAALLLCVGVSACASVPDAHKMLAQAEEESSPPIVMDAKGALTVAQSRNLLVKRGASDALLQHLAVEQTLAKAPLVAGNSAHVLHDGKQTFRAMFAAIKGAHRYIYLEYFILEDIKSDGVKLSSLLIKKRREGVTINMIYDSFGSSSTPPAFFDHLKKNRINVLQFNPLNPLMARNGYSPNSRDHRKILIIDGSTAIVGGVNLSTTYQSSPGKSSGPPGLSAAYWRDTDLELKGPIVAQLEKLFLNHWINQDGPLLHRKKPLPEENYSRGTEIIRAVGSTPDKVIPVYYATLLSAIRHAQKRIWLMSAYFVPTDQQMDDLTDAARRGVDVRILVPDISDSTMAVMVQHSHYEDLLESGVKIYESHNEILHSKTVVIDGIWSVIGSSNFDYRSVVFNDEVDTIVVGHTTAHELEETFEKDTAKAHQIDLHEWNRRPIPQKLHETIEPFWTYVLQSYL